MVVEEYCVILILILKEVINHWFKEKRFWAKWFKKYYLGIFNSSS